MKVEIKKIGILSVLFSAFPLAVFAVMLLSAFIELFSPEAVINVDYFMSLVMHAIQSTILFLLSTVFFLVTYNLLRAIGIRGIYVTLEDKE